MSLRIYAVEQRFPRQPWQLFAVRPIRSEAEQFRDSLQAAAGAGTKYRVREYAPVASGGTKAKGAR